MCIRDRGAAASAEAWQYSPLGEALNPVIGYKIRREGFAVLCCRCGEENRDENEFCNNCSATLGRPCVNGGSGRSTGLPQTTSALLSYLGWWITGLIFYFSESDRFVRFHALQSIFTFGGISLLLLCLLYTSRTTGGGFLFLARRSV